MHALTVLVLIVVGSIVSASGAVSEALTVSEVLASPASYHGKTIRVRGTLWTDGEGALLLESPAKEPDLSHAIAVFGTPDDEIYRKLKAERMRHIQRVKERDPNARWIVFQATVVLEARFEDAATSAATTNPGGDSFTNPFKGCRTKIDLLRVESFEEVEGTANKSVENNAGWPPPSSGRSTAFARRPPGVSHA